MPYPSKTFYKSWITQKMLNNFPEFIHARTCPVSVANQMINFEGILLQETMHDLLAERENQFLTTMDSRLMDHLYVAQVSPDLEWTKVTDANGDMSFTPPRVYGTVNNTEFLIEQAEKNNIETLYYKALPTRIEYDNKLILWNDIIPKTKVSDLSSITPNEMPIEGQLYFILEDNSIWSEEFKDIKYFSKAIIKGRTTKGLDLEEVVPIRFGDTYKTINRWKSISEIEILHVSEDAYITASVLPYYVTSILDPINLAMPIEGKGRRAYAKLEQESFGSVLAYESYLEYDEEYVRRGHDQKRNDYQIELLDKDNNNVNLNGFMIVPDSNYIYAIDDYTFYVYNRLLPFPSMSGMIDESADCRIELTLEDHDWVYKRGEIANVTTRIIDLYSVPANFRWGITLPDGTYYRVGKDGSFWNPEEVDGWIDNEYYENNAWKEQVIPVDINMTGEYILELEARYKDEDTGKIFTRITKLLIYAPSIVPETQIPLPPSLYNCQNLEFDDKGILWLYNGTSIYRTNLFFDYFMIDYIKNKVWLREQYNEVRVVK
jgi:hypothetical protein